MSPITIIIFPKAMVSLKGQFPKAMGSLKGPCPKAMGFLLKGQLPPKAMVSLLKGQFPKGMVSLLKDMGSILKD
jgi:hypothetical protein